MGPSVILADGTALAAGGRFWVIDRDGCRLETHLADAVANQPGGPPLLQAGARIFAPAEAYGRYESALPHYCVLLESAVRHHSGLADYYRTQLTLLGGHARG